MDKLHEHNLEQLTDEEKLLKEENIPGLTIRGQEHELQLLQQLGEHFDTLNGNEFSCDDQNTIPVHEVNLLEIDAEKETENERKIRLGEMTPFGTILQTNSQSTEESRVMKYLRQQNELRQKFKNRNTTVRKIATSNKHGVIRRRRKKIPLGTNTVEYSDMKNSGPSLSERVTVDLSETSGSEYVPSSETDISDTEKDVGLRKKSKSINKRKRTKLTDESEEYTSLVNTPCSSFKSHKIKIHKELDDGNEDEYQSRLEKYEKSCNTTELVFHELSDTDFKIPLEVWSKLYNYQKVGVQWLWELHQQAVGGILADEMGLGKTIQLIVFLSGLYYSKLSNKCTGFRGLGPSLVICPTTLMYQWVKEFHVWFPPARVAVLHACGSFSGLKRNLIRDIYRGRGILITSYAGIVQHSDELLRYNWHYAVLDEGHKIRNPDAKATLVVKQLKTPNRLILSGSPLQNNLEELWSLFDFIYPGKLGALPLFQAQFAVPITHGGYANASDVEVTIAYKCATVLKELISPYLLRRTKVDVKSHLQLPEKNEQVLFCQLTDCQRDLYKTYIESGEVHSILEGHSQIFVGIINLRKICNHPDLYTGGPKLMKHENKDELIEEERYGFWRKSGKMIVLETLLKLWRKQNHKVLLFTQSRQMLDILEIFLNSRDYSLLKLDGNTYIGSRQPLIEKFNSDPDIFIMLLTTKVGGLGVNLTGANRVVIFDPDWNPATDTQARERAWRIGQTQDVTVYRLISVGTIEEKMYHRQIFKQFLTNKVLKDPKQRRFFKSNDLFELFTLKETSDEGSTETGAIFAGTNSEINKSILAFKEKLKKKRLKKEQRKAISLQFSKSKIERMKQFAQRISQNMTKQMSATKKEGEQNGSTETRITPGKSSENENTLYTKSHEENNSPSCSNAVPAINGDKLTEKDQKMHKKKHSKFHFEGEHVPYLVSFKKSKMKIEKQEESEVKEVQDEYVLKKLFSKAGICSAVQHDTIMEGGPADYAIVEKEAERVAQQAIEELKRSQDQCFPAQMGIPNWTGKNGIRTKSQIGSKALSSSDILDKIRKRNGIADVMRTESQILKDLKKFISTEGGTSSTERLIHTFQNELPATVTPLFKCLLNKICTFYRGPDKKGYWTLKDEFLS